MPSLQEIQVLQILEEALASPHGIVVEVTSNEPLPALVHRAKGLLYKVRRDKPAYSNLVIRVDPYSPDTQLWIYVGDEPEVEEQPPQIEGLDL